MGGFFEGEFVGSAIRKGVKLGAVFFGDYQQSPNGPGGTIDGEYLGHERSDGVIEGVYTPPGLDDSGRLGTFSGLWEDTETVSEPANEGNLSGVWLGQQRNDGGVFVGYWTNCRFADASTDSEELEF